MATLRTGQELPIASFYDLHKSGEDGYFHYDPYGNNNHALQILHRSGDMLLSNGFLWERKRGGLKQDGPRRIIGPLKKNFQVSIIWMYKVAQ